MSKEILLKFAKGDSLESKYLIVYHYDAESDQIRIISGSEIQELEQSIFVRTVHSTTEKDMSVPEQKIIEAYKLQIKNKQP